MRLFKAAKQRRLLVVGDVMLDQYLTGRVRRISPEAPVPVVELGGESYVAGGAANVARNVTALGSRAALFGCAGHDEAARVLRRLLKADRVECAGIVPRIGIATTLKIRVLVQRQQIVRLDREQACPLTSREIRALRRSITSGLKTADAVIIADYAKGVITEPLISEIKQMCRERGV